MAIVVRPSISRSSAAWISRSRHGVERRGRLVEDQDPRVLQQDAGDRDPLLLAARQLVAALADDRVVAIGQLGDPVVDRRGPRRGLELGLGRVRPGVAAGSSRIVSWNRYVSWVTKPITSPRMASVTRRTSWPSISTAPSSTSYSRGTR